MKKLLLSLAFILCSVITLFASHQAGYHISMKWISGDNYRFTIISYRDATGISLPSYFDFKIYSKSTNLVVKNFGMNLISDLGLYNSPNNGNCNGSVLGISRGVYQSSLINLQNLNDAMGYYAASDGECCRTSNILNIDGTTSTVYAMQFPAVGSLSPFTHYSSPVISSDPIFNATSGITYNYNLNATDADNDSLVYSMTEPLELVSGGTFVPVAFTPGYNL